MVEKCQTFGIFIFLFKVLPAGWKYHEAVTNGRFTLCIPYFKSYFRHIVEWLASKELSLSFLTFQPFASQASVWVVFIFSKHYDNGMPKKNFFELFLILQTYVYHMSWISMGWWENFAQVRFTTNHVSYLIQNQINELRKYNTKINLLVNTTKIVWTAMSWWPRKCKNNTLKLLYCLDSWNQESK